MYRTGAAQHDHRVVSWVKPALDREHPHRVSHGRVAHGMNADCGLGHGKINPFGHGGDRALRRRRVQLEAAGEGVRIDVTKYHAGVGDGGGHAAAPIAGGAGFGAGAMRTDLKNAGIVDPGDAAATGTDRVHVDHR